MWKPNVNKYLFYKSKRDKVFHDGILRVGAAVVFLQKCLSVPQLQYGDLITEYLLGY